MGEKGFLTDTQKEILSGEYEGSDDAEAAAKYRLRNRTEQALDDLVTVAESSRVDIDDELWYRYIPRLIHAVMAPPDDFVPFPRFDGTEIDHRQQYPLQYALLDRLVQSVDAYEEAFSPKPMAGGLVGDDERPPEQIRELQRSDDDE